MGTPQERYTMVRQGARMHPQLTQRTCCAKAMLHMLLSTADGVSAGRQLTLLINQGGDADRQHAEARGARIDGTSLHFVSTDTDLQCKRST
jgi:hypothetical protein